MAKKFYGVVPPIVTPFDENGSIDVKTLRREVRLMIDSGVHGLSFAGSTGEGSMLTDEEIALGVKTVQEENREGLPLMVGIIRPSAKQAISAGLAAKAAGADALMCTPAFYPPYYHGPHDADNLKYYQEISDGVDLPIIIYNVIGNNPIIPETMKEICKIKNIVGIKQSVGGIHSLTDMIAVNGNDTLVFGAQDDLMYLSYELGAVGAISAILTVFPELMVKQWDAFQAGDYKTAREIHYQILPVWRLIEGASFPGKLKATLKLMGRDCGVARTPIVTPDGADLAELKAALEKGGFIK